MTENYMGEGLREVDLFTDGACSGNPGPGGWAFILRDKVSGKSKEDFGAEALTTNNRMELISVIRGLQTLDRPCQVRLVTDSSYVAKGISEWMAGWKARGWKRKEGNQLKPVKNVELWQELDELLKNHRVKCEWVRGHAGHPENERCDELAVEAYRKLMEAR
ncbi:MAG: ribonuclease HI [Planctomycetota bacterium]